MCLGQACEDQEDLTEIEKQREFEKLLKRYNLIVSDEPLQEDVPNFDNIADVSAHLDSMLFVIENLKTEFVVFLDNDTLGFSQDNQRVAQSTVYRTHTASEPDILFWAKFSYCTGDNSFIDVFDPDSRFSWKSTFIKWEKIDGFLEKNVAKDKFVIVLGGFLSFGLGYEGTGLWLPDAYIEKTIIFESNNIGFAPDGNFSGCDDEKAKLGGNEGTGNVSGSTGGGGSLSGGDTSGGYDGGGVVYYGGRTKDESGDDVVYDKDGNIIQK